MTLYVNGEKVEDAVVEAEIARLRPSYQQAFKEQPENEQNQQLAAWSRENIIETVLFRQEAQKAFPEIADEEVQGVLTGLLQQEGEMGPIRQQLEAGPAEQAKLCQAVAAQLQQEKFSQQITAGIAPPSDKQVRQYYQSHLDRFTMPEMAHVSHIVKHADSETDAEQMRSQMQDILDKLNNGTPFEQLACENSDCPDRAGDLGFFARGKMVPAFEEVAFNLAPGAHSDIFETEFGLHIAKVHEKRPAMPCPLEQVQEGIVRELDQQAKEKAIEQFLDAQKEKAVIEER